MAEEDGAQKAVTIGLYQMLGYRMSSEVTIVDKHLVTDGSSLQHPVFYPSEHLHRSPYHQPSRTEQTSKNNALGACDLGGRFRDNLRHDPVLDV